MDTNRATATAIDRALSLPEVVALIVLHLHPADILACSAVSRSLRESFAPFVWQDLCYGPPWPIDTPSRCIYAQRLPDIAHTAQNRIEAQNQIVATFKDIAPRIRTLTINNHESIFPLQLGAACSQLQSLSISGIPPTEIASAYWVNCRMMMRRNRHHLQSLSLDFWNFNLTTRLQPGQPNWNPILGCTKSWNLRSLSLVCSRIRGRHMAAFWVICSRLESLVLDRVHLHINLPHSPPAKRDEHPTATKIRSGDPPIHMATTVRFPHLKSLTFEYIAEPHPLHQLDLLIGQCPALRTLQWAMAHNQQFPIRSFTDRLMASTWPELDTLIVQYPGLCATDDQFRDILLAVKKPLRKLELNRACLLPETFEVYRTRHFSALESIDIIQSQGNTSRWTIEILTSCPNLRRLRALSLHVEDILQSNKPWICSGLQEMIVFINMGFRNRGPYRRFTEEELDKCRIVFQHLATLKELQVLDMLVTYSNLQPFEFSRVDPKPKLEDRLVPLPLRLKAGLDLLQGLGKLRRVGVWCGMRKMPMKELNWMAQHWKRLEQLVGGWIVFMTLPKEAINGPWTKAHIAWLKKRHISTSGTRYDQYMSWDRDVYDYEDCCGLSDEEEEGDVGSSS